MYLLANLRTVHSTRAQPCTALLRGRGHFVGRPTWRSSAWPHPPGRVSAHHTSAMGNAPGAAKKANLVRWQSWAVEKAGETSTSHCYTHICLQRTAPASSCGISLERIWLFCLVFWFIPSGHRLSLVCWSCPRCSKRLRLLPLHNTCHTQSTSLPAYPFPYERSLPSLASSAIRYVSYSCGSLPFIAHEDHPPGVSSATLCSMSCHCRD